MNKDSSSVLGKTEQVGVGIFRAPVLVGKVIGRVRELLKNPNRGGGGGGGKGVEEEEEEEEEVEV